MDYEAMDSERRYFKSQSDKTLNNESKRLYMFWHIGSVGR